DAASPDQQGKSSLCVRRFTEKPDLATARQFLDAGNYFWNSGMFLWRADTLANALHEHHVAKTRPGDGSLASASGSFAFNAKNNYVHAPGKFVALVGVSNLVI